MAPRSSIPTSLYLLAVLVPLFLLQMCGATMHTCVIYGNGVTDAVKSEIDVDTGKLLQKLKGYEGAGYASVAPGQSARRRDLALNLTSTLDAALGAGSVTNALIDCPNSCRNSGSNYCKSLGCAYCGTCNRRELTYVRRGLAKAATVEKWINKDLAGYCQGVAGCSLWAKIFVVNEDGSLTPAP